MKALLLASVLIAVTAAQAVDYKVEVTGDKKFNFAGLKTYVWTKGQPSMDPAIDRQIMAAVDRELGALGLTKQAAEPGDVLVTYYSQQRTSVDVKAKPNDKGVRPQYPVGTLIVGFLQPGNRKQALRLRLDTPIDAEPAQLSDAINAGVAALFARYPTRQPL